MPKPKRTFADIDAARKRYNPEVEGYGNPRQWRGAFYERMGFEEATRIMSGQERTPYEILGVMKSAMWDEIRSAFRKKSMDCHPDRVTQHGLSVDEAVEQFKQLSAAYSVLAHRMGK